MPPLTHYLRQYHPMQPDESSFALFDDNLDCHGDLLLSGLIEKIECGTRHDVVDAFAAIEAALRSGHWIALAAHYELGYALEPRLHACLDRASGPLLTAWVFERSARLDAAATVAWIDARIAPLDEHARSHAVARFEHTVDADQHRAAVGRIQHLIDAGDCYQVNYTFASRGHLSGHPLALYRTLRERQPVRYGAFLSHSQGTILSRSPELFVERRGRKLVCRPMKGTAAADSDPAQLRRSEKDCAENLMIVDLIRNDLGRLAPPGGVRVEGLFDVERYPSVMQMTSTVSAEPVDADLLAVFRALFPCGSITGAPRIRAMEIIHELESAPRGLYCGALGWIAPDGDFRFSVPIRTLVTDGDGRFRMGIGSGIVADSDPANEWAECLLKARFLSDTRPGFGLIETLRCNAQADPPYPLFERHLRRISSSAACLAFRVDIAAVRIALLTHAETLEGEHRVRLLLQSDGTFQIESAVLHALPPQPPSVILSALTVRSSDPLLRHKTTLRDLYDAELARAVELGHFDVLFFNERDELAEGARSNVFVDLGDGVLLTPPLDSGVLDGVYRRTLLDEGKAREARLTRADLTGARAIYVANALRGLLHVRLH